MVGLFTNTLNSMSFTLYNIRTCNFVVIKGGKYFVYSRLYNKCVLHALGPDILLEINGWLSFMYTFNVVHYVRYIFYSSIHTLNIISINLTQTYNFESKTREHLTNLRFRVTKWWQTMNVNIHKKHKRSTKGHSHVKKCYLQELRLVTKSEMYRNIRQQCNVYLSIDIKCNCWAQQTVIPRTS